MSYPTKLPNKASATVDKFAEKGQGHFAYSPLGMLRQAGFEREAIQPWFDSLNNEQKLLLADWSYEFKSEMLLGLTRIAYEYRLNLDNDDQVEMDL